MLFFVFAKVRKVVSYGDKNYNDNKNDIIAISVKVRDLLLFSKCITFALFNLCTGDKILTQRLQNRIINAFWI